MVATSHTCDSPATFDLGGRALQIQAGKVLSVTGGDGHGTLTITGATSMTLATGAKIVAQGAMGVGGNVFIGSNAQVPLGHVSLAAMSAIDVSSDAGDGVVEIDVASGNVQLSGAINAQANKTNGSGGIVVVTTGQAGDIVVDTAGIKASGGDSGDGGSIDLEAAGNLTVSAPVDLSAGCGGDLTLMAGTAGTGNVLIAGAIDGSGSGADGCSGPIDVTAAGDVTLDAPINLRSGDIDDVTFTADGSIDSTSAGKIDATLTVPGGTGPDISFTATGSGTVTLHGDITVKASGDDTNGSGVAGEVDVTSASGSVELGGTTDVSCTGPDALGGVVTMQAGLDLTLSGPIDAGTGNTGTGGMVSMSAQRFVSVASSIDVSGGSTGGTIAVTSTDSLMVLGDDETNHPVILVADGTGPHAQGGNITLTACSLSLFHDAIVSALGTGTFPAAGNLLQGTMQLKVYAKLRAGSANRLEYRDALPVVGASILPDADIELNPNLLCCDGVACAPTSTTTTSTTSSTTAQATTSTVVTTTVPSSQPASTSTTSAPSTAVPATSTSAPATSTSAPASATTSTTLPTSCLDQPLEGFDGVDCRLRTLSDMLASEPPELLGGTKSARMLKAKIVQVLRLVDTARTKRKPAATLRQAKQVLKLFRTLAKRGMRRHHIDERVGAQLVTLASETASLIDSLRSAP